MDGPGPARHLGVDIGTSVAKVALFDGGGTVLRTADRAVPLDHPAPGHVEQDGAAVFAAVGELTREVCRTPADAPDLVAVTGQGDGCWLLDADARPVGPALSWLDGRAAEVLAGWDATGVTEAIHARTGNALFPGAQAPLLAWLDKYQPDRLAAAATAGYCKDMVFGRLTGVRATDASDSSLPFGDGTGTGYDAAVLQACGLAHRAELLAPVVTPLPTGTVTGRAAGETGLPAGAAVTGGPYDLPACAAGGGVTGVGDGLLTLGTTLACQVLVSTVDRSGPRAGMYLATGEPGRWLRAMPAMVGTASLDWLLTLLGRRHDQLDGMLTDTAPGAGGVEVLPYLAPSGERAPFVDPAARGQFTGIELTTSAQHLVRALCEGLAYAARQCLEAAGLSGRLVVCGGGTRSLPWLSIFASVLGRPLELARSPEVGARGAVLAGLAALGRPVDRASWTRPERVIDPDPAAARYYESGYRRYLANQDAARPRWQR